jgi:hypothetical protein
MSMALELLYIKNQYQVFATLSGNPVTPLYVLRVTDHVFLGKLQLITSAVLVATLHQFPVSDYNITD